MKRRNFLQTIPLAGVGLSLNSFTNNKKQDDGLINDDRSYWMNLLIRILQLGFCGHQTEMADTYTSTGSLYLCTNGFLALGLPVSHSFWSDPPADWTAKKAWSGQAFLKISLLTTDRLLFTTKSCK